MTTGGQKRIPSREGGVEVVVEELATRMAQQGHSVTCYNRGGHHVSGSAFDAEAVSKYKGVRLKTVPTIVQLLSILQMMKRELRLGKRVLILYTCAIYRFVRHSYFYCSSNCLRWNAVAFT